MKSQAASGFLAPVIIMADTPVPGAEWSTVPSSRIVPGTTVKSQRPRISGAKTVSWLNRVKSAMATGISPVRNRLTKS